VLVVERNFAEFSGKFARDHFGKHHEPSARLGTMVRRHWKDPAPSEVQTQDPKTKVSPRLKATVGLMEIEAVEIAMRSSADPLPGAPAVGVSDRQPNKGSTQGR
jgi:hypothetical protein